MAPRRLSQQSPNLSFPTEQMQSRTAGPVFAPPPLDRRERGIIVGVDTRRHAYRVQLANGGPISSMGRIKQGAGDLDLLSVGTPVRVDFSLGEPYIDGVLPISLPEDSEEIVETIGDPNSPTASDLSQNDYGVNYRVAGEPTDLIAGDCVMRAPQGALVAALNGRLAFMRGSRLAELALHGDGNHGELRTGTWRHWSWMGYSEIENSNGAMNYRWRGSPRQVTPTTGDSVRYAVQLDVGAAGDLIDLKVVNSTNQTLFRLHVNPQGRCEMFAAGGIDQTGGGLNGQPHIERRHGDSQLILRGNRIETVEGRHQVVSQSGHTSEVIGDRTLHTSQDLVIETGRQLELHTGRSKLETVGGDLTLTVGTPGASNDLTERIFADVSRTVTGGVTETVVGSRTTNSTGSHSDTVATTRTLTSLGATSLVGGTVSLTSTSGGVSLSSSVPVNGIRLGSGTSHVTKWEQLIPILQALVTMIDGHTHIVTPAAGPIPAMATPPTGSPTNAAMLTSLTVSPALLPGNPQSPGSTEVVVG